MNRIIYFLFRAFFISVLLLSNTLPLAAQTPSELFASGLEMTDKAVRESDMWLYSEGLKIMEQAAKKDKERGDWCYEIGKRNACYVRFGGSIFIWDEETGRKWFEKGVRLGDLRSSLALFRRYKPKSQPKILSPKKEWDIYFKDRDKCMEYASIALTTEVPSGFDNYLSLSQVAAFVDNQDLANRYRALAAENNEDGALDNLIIDVRALEYLTSPEIMYQASLKIWNENAPDKTYRDRNRRISFEWLKKSAKSGYPLAQNSMGLFYLKGIMVKPDTLKAVSWLKQAAEANVAEATSILGRLYVKGEGVERDFEKGIRYLLKSAENNIVDSEFYLGFCYLYGLGVEKDIAKARTSFRNYLKSVYGGAEDNDILNSKAIFKNRMIDPNYLIGLTHYYEESSECLRFFEKSLEGRTFNGGERGDLLRKLASCYSEGKYGIKPDPARAAVLLEEAAKYGEGEIDSENFRF